MAILGYSPICWSTGALMLRAAPGPRMTIPAVWRAKCWPINPEFLGVEGGDVGISFPGLSGAGMKPTLDIQPASKKIHHIYVISEISRPLALWTCAIIRHPNKPLYPTTFLGVSTHMLRCLLLSQTFSCQDSILQCCNANSWSNLGKVIINDVSVFAGKIRTGENSIQKYVCCFCRSQTVCAKRIPNLWEFLDAKVPDFLDGQLPRNSLICRELWQQWLSCREPLMLRENRCLGRPN